MIGRVSSNNLTYECRWGLLRLTYYDLKKTINKEEIPERWRIAERGPFDKNGNVNTAYFHKLSPSFAEKIFNRFSDRFVSEIDGLSNGR